MAIVMLLLAIGTGLATTYLAYRWMNKRIASASTNKGGFLTRAIAIAASDLEPGAKLHPESFKVVQWPMESVPKMAAVNPDQLNNRVVVTQIMAGEPILQSKLAAEGTEGGLAAIITQGRRAMSVKIDEVTGVAGFVLPGSRVDVLVSVEDKENRKLDTTAQIILQNLRVLTSGQKLVRDKDQDKPILVNVVTLEVTPDEAEKLTLAAHRGRLQLALRRYADSDEVNTSGISLPRLIRPGKEEPTPRPVSSTGKKVIPRPAAQSPPKIIEIMRGEVKIKVEVK